MEREVTKKKINILRSYPEQKSRASVWATSYSLLEKDVIVTFKAFDIATRNPLDEFSVGPLATTLNANVATEITSFWVPNTETSVVAAYLHCAGNKQLLARMVSWPDPLKFVKFSVNPRVSVFVDEGEDRVVVNSCPGQGVCACHK